MTMSSASSSGISWSSVDCTMAAGSMSQRARGFSSLATKSSSEPAPVAPSRLELLDRVGVDVVDDAAVAVAHQPADEVGPHPAEPDHAELHWLVGCHCVLS